MKDLKEQIEVIVFNLENMKLEFTKMKTQQVIDVLNNALKMEFSVTCCDMIKQKNKDLDRPFKFCPICDKVIM